MADRVFVGRTGLDCGCVNSVDDPVHRRICVGFFSVWIRRRPGNLEITATAGRDADGRLGALDL